MEKTAPQQQTTAVKKKIKTIVVDTLNQIQNNQYMKMLDRGTMVTRDKWKDFGVEIYMFMVEDLQSMGFETILVLGYEGTGKSFGIKYLPPGTNIWYNADRKNPTFKNVEYKGSTWPARKVYGTKVKPSQFMVLPKNYKDITNHLDTVKKAGMLDENPIAFLIAHIDDYRSGDDGEMRQRLKTLGNLATKMNIEGEVENCFYTNLHVDGDKVSYRLDTQNSGKNTARSLEQAFETRYIENNFQIIVEAIDNY